MDSGGVTVLRVLQGGDGRAPAVGREAGAGTDPRLREWTLEGAQAADAPEFVRLRGLTRENAVSRERLAQLGITPEQWAAQMLQGELLGWVARHPSGELLGYAFGHAPSGEVVVLVVMPQAEGCGIGRRLLAAVMQQLQAQGHRRLFLGCSTDPTVRSYGFYRHLGWRGTGAVDDHGDEVLEWCAA